MQKIKIDLSKYQNKPKTKISQRAEIVGMFLEKLNSERGKYPPLKPARIAMLLSPIKEVSNLRAFFGECNNSKNFASYFWWRLKK